MAAVDENLKPALLGAIAGVILWWWLRKRKDCSCPPPTVVQPDAPPVAQPDAPAVPPPQPPSIPAPAPNCDPVYNYVDGSMYWPCGDPTTYRDPPPPYVPPPPAVPPPYMPPTPTHWPTCEELGGRTLADGSCCKPPECTGSNPPPITRNPPPPPVSTCPTDQQVIAVLGTTVFFNGRSGVCGCPNGLVPEMEQAYELQDKGRAGIIKVNLPGKYQVKRDSAGHIANCVRPADCDRDSSGRCIVG